MPPGNKDRRTPHRRGQCHDDDVGPYVPTILINHPPYDGYGTTDLVSNQPTATSATLAPRAGHSGNSAYFRVQEQGMSWAAVSTTEDDMGGTLCLVTHLTARVK